MKMKQTPLAAAKQAVRELIRASEDRMYMSSYEAECLEKLKVIRRGLYSRNRKAVQAN